MDVIKDEAGTVCAPIYLEDLLVGDVYRSVEHHVDEEQILAFARQFDPQPFHTDAQAASKTLFGGLAASGWHTAAITMRLLVQSVPLGHGLIGAGGEIEWPAPTRPGDTLHVVTKIRDIVPSRSKPDRGIVTFEFSTLNQDGQLCQRLLAKLVVQRRSE